MAACQDLSVDRLSLWLQGSGVQGRGRGWMNREGWSVQSWFHIMVQETRLREKVSSGVRCPG